MKKLVLLTSAVVLVLTSCSEDEMMSVNSGRAIDFRAETASRGTETTSASITNFYVSAYKGGGAYFENLQYSRNISTDFFESYSKQYWPQDDSELLFFAYSPSSETLGGTLSTQDGTLTGFQPSPNVAKHVDFVYAQATGKRSENEKTGVNLGFKHALSQVVVQAKNAGDLTFKISGIKIIGAAKSGDFDVAATPTWTTGTEYNAPYKIFYDPITLTGTEQSLMGSAGGAIVIPQALTAWDQSAANENDGAYLAIRVQVLDKDGATVIFPVSNEGGTEYGWVAVPLNTNWEAGKKYVYTLDFETGAGLVAPPTGENPEIDPVNPTDDDPDNPKTGEDELHPGGDKDPGAPKPGDPALGTPIKFCVSISNWNKVDDSPKMDL